MDFPSTTQNCVSQVLARRPPRPRRRRDGTWGPKARYDTARREWVASYQGISRHVKLLADLARGGALEGTAYHEMEAGCAGEGAVCAWVWLSFGSEHC